jgi:Cu-Zn family superoxide dismutase
MNAIAYFDKNSSVNQLGVSGVIKIHQCCPRTNSIVTIELHNLPPNSTRAIHIHEFGNITKGCMSAGPHYNPYNKNHGNIDIHGKERHVGDLINNITSNSNGDVFFEYEDDLVKLFGPTSVIGRSIVIHKKPDDLGMGGDKESLKTGNAGDRMACTIIGLDKPNPN